MTRARVARLLAMPLLILLVAGILKLTAERTDGATVEKIERAATVWCAAAARGDRPDLPIDPLLAQTAVRKALEGACRSGGGAAYSLSVERGSGDQYEVVIATDGRVRLELQVVCRPEPVIVGFRLP